MEKNPKFFLKQVFADADAKDGGWEDIRSGSVHAKVNQNSKKNAKVNQNFKKKILRSTKILKKNAKVNQNSKKKC